MKDIRQRRYRKVETMVDACQLRARTQVFMRSAALLASKMKTQDRRATMILLKETLRKLSLSEWPLFIDDLQLI